MRIKVKVWSDSYYPCGYQLKPVNERVCRRIKAVLRDTYYSEATAVAVCDNLATSLDSLVSPRVLRETQSAVDHGGSATIIVDAWTFAHLYGYDAHTAFE